MALNMENVGDLRAIFPYLTSTALENVNTSNFKIAFLDLNDRFIFVNGAMKKAFSCLATEPTQNSILDILNPTSYAAYASIKKELLDSDRFLASLSTNISGLKNFNQLDPLQLILYLIRDPNNNPLYLRLLLRDQNEIEKCSSATSESGNELNKAHVIYSEVDQNGIFTRCEGKFTHHLISPVVGKHFSEVYKSLPESQERIRRAMTGEDFDTEVNASGLWFHVWYSPLFDQNGNPSGASWTSSPIDPHKRRTIKLQKTVDQTREAVQAREDLLSMASHEIKNPLSALSVNYRVIEGYLDLDTNTSRFKNSIQSLLKSSQRFIERISLMTQRFLDTSSLSEEGLALKCETCDLSMIVKDTAQKYINRGARLPVKIRVEAPENLFISCDSLRMEEIIDNLLTNAIKYGGGSLVTLRLSQADQEVLITVQDQGPGISIGDQSKIFGRFVRSEKHKNTPGFGMGLYIVKQIAEAHGGSIRVESELNKGSTFIVSIPHLKNKT